MNKKIEISIDAEPWITEDGIEVGVYVGDEDEPIVYQYTWDDLINLAIECQRILSFKDKTVFAKDKDNTLTKLEKIAQSLEAGAAKIYDLIDNSYIFDREAWLKANEGEYNQENKDQFLTEVKDGQDSL